MSNTAIVRGRLNTTMYEGHRVQLQFYAHQTIAAASLDGPWLPSMRTSTVTTTGHFEILLPSARHMRHPFTFTVTTLDGTVVYREELERLPTYMERDIAPHSHASASGV